jgi:carotenoid cleavage dioxygenase
MFRFLDNALMGPRLHRWRLNLGTGIAKEEALTDTVSEFGMINDQHRGRSYRYSYSATSVPGWFLFDGIVKHDALTGRQERYRLEEGVFASETAMAPRVGAQGEDDGYLVTITSDMNRDLSECLVFDARNLHDGPVCRVRLPERVSSGTHSTWAAGSAIPDWSTRDDPAAALHL